MKYVVDAYAWVSYLIGEVTAEKVKSIVENESNEIFTNNVTLSEVISAIKRENRDYEESYKVITSLSNIYIMNPAFAKQAGLLHAEIRRKIKDFGLADTFVLLTARKLRAKIITGDKHFKGFKEAVFIG